MGERWNNKRSFRKRSLSQIITASIYVFSIPAGFVVSGPVISHTRVHTIQTAYYTCTFERKPMKVTYHVQLRWVFCFPDANANTDGHFCRLLLYFFAVRPPSSTSRGHCFSSRRICTEYLPNFGASDRSYYVISLYSREVEWKKSTMHKRVLGEQKVSSSRQLFG